MASLLAGLGLFFVGLNFLTEHLKMLSGRRLRERISTWTKNPFLGMLWGGVFIAITQSSSATTFILIGMLRSGMMKVRQALPIIVGINMLGGIIILVLVFDIKIWVLFLLGITGLIYTNDRTRRLRTIAGVAFGIGMLFFGLSTMQSGVAPLTKMPWFEGALEWTKGSYLLGFAIAAVLSFLVQSSIAVIVLAIALERTGLFSLNEAMMIVYGAHVGSSFLTLALSYNLSGQSKQIAMFQTMYNFVGAILLIPMFYVELLGSIPLVKAFTVLLSKDGSIQIGIVTILFNFVPGVFLLALLKPVAHLLGRFWPETLEEQVSKPKYLHENATIDPQGALRLIELEQIRLIEILSESFGAMRAQNDQAIPAFQEAFKILSGTIREAVSDLSSQRNLSVEAYNQLNKLLNLQASLETANTEVNGLGSELSVLRRTPFGARFSQSAIEGLDAILLTLMDVAKEHSDKDANLLQMMTSEDGIASVRKAYLAEESELDSAGRMQLLSASNHSERLIWLFGEMGRAYMAL